MSTDNLEYDILKQPLGKSFLGIRLSALYEIFLFFLFTTVIAWFAGTSINFFTVSPHPFWIVVVLISVQYGTNEGLIAALASTVVWLLGAFPEQTILQNKFQYSLFIGKMPILWFCSAVVLGELRMRQIRERDRLRQAAAEAAAKEQKIADAYEAMKKIKERLEIHVASDLQTTLMAITAFKRLEDSGKEDGIVQGAGELVQTLVSPEKFSIFIMQSGVLKFVMADGWEPSDTYMRSFGPDALLFQEVIGKGKAVFIHRSDPYILANQGVAAVPIMAPNKQEVYGMIKIEQIPLIRLRTTAIETLETIGEWVGTAYEHFHERAGK